MNLRKAILKAADHIEANPGLYNYQCLHAPECGTQGCMAGWVAHFLGFPAGIPVWSDDCVAVLGVTSHVFFDRLFELAEKHDRKHSRFLQFTGTAKDAALILRCYANVYHPEKLPDIQSSLTRIAALPSAQIREVA